MNIDWEVGRLTMLIDCVYFI